jgi:predicted enzyme related to lactoylglutathione lyase
MMPKRFFFKFSDTNLKNYTTMVFKNAISWFEIPAGDLSRAQKFYEAIFDIRMIPMDTPHIKMRMFPIADPANGIGGAVCHAEFYKPSATDGPLVYLNANPDVQLILDKVKAAGGQVIVPKTEISPEHGHMGIFIDTEGNRIGLHSVPAGFGG